MDFAGLVDCADPARPVEPAGRVVPVGSQPTGDNKHTAVQGVVGMSPVPPPGGPAVGVLLLPARAGYPLASLVLPADL